MDRSGGTKVGRLRVRAERALEQGRCRAELLPILERLAQEAPEYSEHQAFACRCLAETYLEHHPWRSALYARRLIRFNREDDGAYALMGLAQTLLGNFKASVRAYQRALELAPDNPWYHHNLGHLLDVCMGDISGALVHLRLAHRLASEHDEVTASLVHCLARVGQLEEAKAMAERIAERSPDNREHRALLAWIAQGAPRERDIGATGELIIEKA